MWRVKTNNQAARSLHLSEKPVDAIPKILALLSKGNAGYHRIKSAGISIA